MTAAGNEDLAGRLIGAATGALEMQSIYLGRRLGLYDHLRTSRTAAELAEAAGIGARYAREWLEQQAVAGFVSVEGDPEGPKARFWLDPQQLAVFVESESPAHVAPLADMLGGGGLVIDRVVAAYRNGTGVPYSAYGPAFREGQSGINRPAFVGDLPTTWIQAAPDVAARLEEGGRIADLGCGTGWSTVAMARAFPKAEVIGFDSDGASITDAKSNARTSGVKVEFVEADASEMSKWGPFDLVMLLEVLHDLSRPVEVLESARASLRAGGAVLVADEKVAERFQPNGDELERMMYGWSVTYCLPASLAEEPSAALGTALRARQVRGLAEMAGFQEFEISDIDAGFFRLYVLRP